MKKKHAVAIGTLVRSASAVRAGIILLVAVFAVSGSLHSADNAKTAAIPCVKGNCQNGKGEMNFASGDSYKGMFRKGTMHGQGERAWKSGDRYKGMWKDGKMDGRGEMKWAIGDRYSGMWKANLMDGVGEMTWKNGMKYTGQWKNGRQHGNGVLISTDRKMTRGKWENGTMIVEPPKGGAIVVAGTWKNLCLDSPFGDEMSHTADVTFNANKTGVQKKKFASESGITDVPFTWELKGTELTMKFKGDDRDPFFYFVYNYDNQAKIFLLKKEEFGPKGNVSRCQLKK